MIEFFSTYPYFLGSLYLLLVWLVIFFISKKQQKKEMLAMGIIGVIAGVFGGIVYYGRWWVPELLFPNVTPYGVWSIEDVITGFAIMGIATAAGHLTFSSSRKSVSEYTFRKAFSIVFVLALVALFFHLLFMNVLNLNLFFTVILIGAVFFILLLFRCRRSWRFVFKTSIITTFVALPFYYLPMIANPTWVDEQWLKERFFGPELFSVPFEEFVWFLIVSGVIAIAWEYARGVCPQNA